MAVTINTFSNFGNQPVTIQIDGATPTELTLISLKIDYSDNEVADYIIDWKGAISFFGRTELFDEFGVIKHKSHKITINYGTDKQFVGYLFPEIYNIPNTGFEEEFTLNFESSLSTLSRELFTETINLYSIQYILDKMLELTGISNVEVKKTFLESLDRLKIYSANFVNDDSKNENYLTILEWICTTFSMKCLMGWDNVLYLTSFELLNGSDPYPLENHLGIDEDYSISKTIDTVSVNVSNFAMPEIPANFDLSNSVKVRDPKPMRIRQGRKRIIGKKGSWHRYFRQIYQFNPGQNSWRLCKYDSNFNPLSDADIYDSSKYIINGIPLCGVYPIAWGTSNGDGSGFQGFEEALWFKLYNNDNFYWNISLQKLMTLELDNFLIPSNSFFSTSFDAMFCAHIGDVNSWDYASHVEDYDADNDSTFSSNMSEGLVRISPNISFDLLGPPPLTLAMSISWTELSGTIKYWDANANIPNWTTDNSKEYFDIRVNATSEFEFGSSTGIMPAPMEESGIPAIFEVQKRTDIWCRFPGTMGKLNISFGYSRNNIADIKGGVLFRNLNFQMNQSITDVSNIDLSQMDVLYSNMDVTNQVNADYDKSATFYMYSNNSSSGRGQLFNNSADTRIDELFYTNPYGTEKPEHHYIRLAKKWESNAKVYNDIISFDDIKAGYEDLFFNGGSFDLIEGIANIQLVSCNQDISGDL